MMYWYDGHGINGWGWALMSIGMVLFWVLVITGVGRDDRARRDTHHCRPGCPPGRDRRVSLSIV